MYPVCWTLVGCFLVSAEDVSLSSTSQLYLSSFYGHLYPHIHQAVTILELCVENEPEAES